MVKSRAQILKRWDGVLTRHKDRIVSLWMPGYKDPAKDNDGRFAHTLVEMHECVGALEYLINGDINL